MDRKVIFFDEICPHEMPAYPDIQEESNTHPSLLAGKIEKKINHTQLNLEKAHLHHRTNGSLHIKIVKVILVNQQLIY